MERYDPETGQVFHERIFKPDLFENWEQKRRKLKGDAYRPIDGADTLCNMVLRRLDVKAHQLDPHTLRPVPPALAEKIWKMLRHQ